MLPIYIVDAFTSKRFAGNQAAVVPLEQWLADDHLQAIAAENNLSETAFIQRDGEVWHLRWFTPVMEVTLCGHATLASAWVIFNQLDPECHRITFSTRWSGLLHVERQDKRMVMNFPAVPYKPSPDSLANVLGVEPEAVFETEERYLAVLANADDVRRLNPDIAAILNTGRHVIVTAPGDGGYDCISRFFAPVGGIPEDPVTGSAHCMLTPYWAERLGKSEIRAFQASSRGGELLCRIKGDRVELEGECVPYLAGMIEDTL